ncbi:MAG: DNA-binding protein [Spirochaetales bacterium]|nr:DNA-binding protein [Spirochaetales bacterium]
MKEKTTESVRKIALAMILAGKEPTIRNVRAQLGHGSASTIGPALREWKLELFAKMRSREMMTARFPDIISPFVWDLWEKAVEEAQSRFNSEREELIRVREAAIAQRNMLADRCASLEKRLAICEKSIGL